MVTESGSVLGDSSILSVRVVLYTLYYVVRFGLICSFMSILMVDFSRSWTEFGVLE
jgi:hypothetical protein